MCKYFHVIEREVGGSIDAYRRAMGRVRESGHFHDERQSRLACIHRNVGFGHVVRQCIVDTGHPAGYEAHVLTSTGVVMVFNVRTKKLVTMLVARHGQVERYYRPFGEKVPEELMARAYENTCVHHWNR